MRRIFVVLTAMGLAAGMLTPASAQRGATTETADVVGQGPGGDLIDGAEATLRRTDNGLQAKVTMPTPQPGAYDYPPPEGTVAEQGHPEGFTLWVFVFDHTQGTFGGAPWSTVFLGAGHMVGGDTLTLSGQVTTNTEPFAGHPLENPRDVDVTLTVAPHGGLDPELMPAQIKTPGGGPPMWWHAVFGDPIFE